MCTFPSYRWFFCFLWTTHLHLFLRVWCSHKLVSFKYFMVTLDMVWNDEGYLILLECTQTHSFSGIWIFYKIHFTCICIFFIFWQILLCRIFVEICICKSLSQWLSPRLDRPPAPRQITALIGLTREGRLCWGLRQQDALTGCWRDCAALLMVSGWSQLRASFTINNNNNKRFVCISWSKCTCSFYVVVVLQTMWKKEDKVIEQLFRQFRA